MRVSLGSTNFGSRILNEHDRLRFEWDKSRVLDDPDSRKKGLCVVEHVREGFEYQPWCVRKITEPSKVAMVILNGKGGWSEGKIVDAYMEEQTW